MEVLESYPDDEVWDRVAEELRSTGVSSVHLKESSLQDVSKAAFEASEQAFMAAEEGGGGSCWSDCPVIQEEAESAHVTGYHPAGSLSRYNEFRKGLVFSDGQRISCSVVPEFEIACERLEELLHSVADKVLRGIERNLDLPADWFQESLGPTRSNSQWHMKQFVRPPGETDSQQAWLPGHTDPSLISVVIHNRPGRQRGGQGLKVKTGTEWKEIPWSGHGVAVIITGSVLENITHGHYRAATHTVRQQPSGERMAATLFLRPAPAALLRTPPSPQLPNNSSNSTKQPTFQQWNARVARKYEKKKKTAKIENSELK
jgi:isopenicillin N synthase-like dioxygenase